MMATAMQISRKYLEFSFFDNKTRIVCHGNEDGIRKSENRNIIIHFDIITVKQLSIVRVDDFQLASHCIVLFDKNGKDMEKLRLFAQILNHFLSTSFLMPFFPLKNSSAPGILIYFIHKYTI